MHSDFDEVIRRRADDLFRQHQEAIYRRTDRLFAALMLLQWLAAIAAACWVSPLTWAGRDSQIHLHVWTAIILGGIVTIFPVALAAIRPGRATTRYIIAVGQMLMSGLLIHLSGGRIETHFHVFGSLAFLAFYRDWRVFIPATAVVAADHFLRGVYWPESVYGVLTAASWRWLEHSAWVMFEDSFLLISCHQSLQEMRDIAWQRAALEVANASTEQTVVTRTAELQASEERFRSLSAASPIGIFETDPQGRGIYVNARWAEIAGTSSEAALGEGWTEALHPDDREAVIASWSRAVREERESLTEFRMQTPQGETRWVSARTKPLVAEDGHVTGHVGTLEDITARKHSESELADARDRALDATRLKSEFLANMSHEIRTPMNAIIGMTDIALDNEMSVDQRECLETVKLSSRALLTLLNDVLDLSKIESGRLNLDVVPFSLRDGVGDTLRTLAVRAHHQGLELACDVAADVPDAIVGDAGRLRQIVINLVGNAIKFTQSGEVVIRVRVAERQEHEAVLHFAVSDTGIGIAPEKQSVIFAPFVQVDGSMTRHYGGTGLGLSIASQLSEMMGGRIWVESALGRGSTFHFSIHVGLGAEVQPARADGSALSGVRALVVDDNATTRGILVAMLEGWGMTSLAVGDGESALATLVSAQRAGTPFELALLDAHMPRMDGVTLARSIDVDPRLADLRMILLTSSGLNAQRIGELRRVSSLAKPIVRSHLLEAIQAQRAGRVQEYRPTQRIQQSDRPLRVLVAEDNALNRKVVVRLLSIRGHTVVAVADGAQAVAALRDQPFDVILMDVQMPGMGGYEATAAIRAWETGTGGHVPIVALTAHAMNGDRERCLEAGMDAYVAKPVEADELFETIERFPCGQRGARASASRAPQASPILDRDAIHRRVGDDAEFLLDILATFRVESIRLRSELYAAIARRDPAEVVHAAHSLKGALATLAACAAADAAEQLESIARDRDVDRIDEACERLDAELRRLETELSTLEEATLRGDGGRVPEPQVNAGDPSLGTNGAR